MTADTRAKLSEQRPYSAPPVLAVLDDDANIVEMIQFAALRIGFEVHIATNAMQFQKIVCEYQPTVVLLDIIMPDMDGNEVVEWLVEQRLTVSIILMSGFDGRYLTVVKNLCQARGADVCGTLSKPFSISELKSTLTKFV